MVYIKLKKHDRELEKKRSEKTKNTPRLVSFPFPLYDVESRLFSGNQSRPKTNRSKVIYLQFVMVWFLWAII